MERGDRCGRPIPQQPAAGLGSRADLDGFGTPFLRCHRADPPLGRRPGAQRTNTPYRIRFMTEPATARISMGMRMASPWTESRNRRLCSSGE